MNKGLHIVFIVCLGFVFKTNAQVLDDTAVFSTIVITGQINPTQLSKTVDNIKIISMKTIERQGAATLNDLLSQQLNIRLNNDNILGSSMSLQGLSGQNIKIMIDGVPVVGRENGNIDLNQINLNQIERIEIVEGPMSVIYGSDALGGVINLISKSMAIKEPYKANFSSYYETIGRYNVGGGAIVKLGDFDFSASLNRNFWDGFSNDPSSRTMLWKPKRQWFGNFGLLSEHKNLKIRFKVDIFNEKIENRLPAIINVQEAYGEDQYYITNRIINSLNLDYKFKNKAYWNSVFAINFYQRDLITYLKDLVSLEETLVDNPTANTRNVFLNFMSRGTYSKQSDLKVLKHSYQLGYDVNLNQATGTKIESARGSLNEFALFGCAEINPTKNISIKPGIRANFNSKYSAPFIPSLQIMLKSKKGTTFRMAYGRGFRAPSLKELYLDFVDNTHNIKGNDNLKAEISDNFNAALKYRVKSNKEKVIINFENNFFYNFVKNQISLVSVNPLEISYTYQNIDLTKTIGTNFNVNSQFKKYLVILGFSYIGLYNSAFETINKKSFQYTPEFRTQFTYTYTDKQKIKTYFSLFYKFNGKQYGYAKDFKGEVSPIFTDQFSMLDCSLNRPFWGKRVNATLGVKNILNVTTVNSFGVSPSFHGGRNGTMPISIGRSLFIQLNFNL